MMLALLVVLGAIASDAFEELRTELITMLSLLAQLLRQLPMFLVLIEISLVFRSGGKSSRWCHENSPKQNFAERTCTVVWLVDQTDLPD